MTDEQYEAIKKRLYDMANQEDVFLEAMQLLTYTEELRKRIELLEDTLYGHS